MVQQRRRLDVQLLYDEHKWAGLVVHPAVPSAVVAHLEQHGAALDDAAELRGEFEVPEGDN